MIKYRFAFGPDKKLMSAEKLVAQAVPDPLTCISCGQPMIARVNGKVQRPHFAHKVLGECNGETYLHRLGKLVFYETYTRCLATGAPFVISFKTPKICDRFKGLIACFSNLGENHHEYDLTQYYSDICQEHRDDSFIPDILLRSKTRKNDAIYVEIAVSHFLSEAKSSSHKRIIEIPIRCEDDVEAIRTARLTSEKASFIGFTPAVRTVPDDECLCGKVNVYAFFVFQSGKSFLDYKPLTIIYNKMTQYADKIIYTNILRDYQCNYDPDIIEMSLAGIFIDQVKLAHKQNVLIKNCFLCRYHGENYYKSSPHSIFCKTYRKPCNSNNATDCDRYRI